MLTRRDNNQEEASIQASNFGGLNTTASPVNMPLGDASILQNIDVDVSGRLSKRKGTRQIFTESPGTGALSCFGFTSNTGLPLLASSNGTFLTISNIYNDVQTPLVSWGGIFNFKARDIAFVIIPGKVLRLLVLTPNHPPIQVSIYEHQVIVPSPPSVTADLAFNEPLTGTGAFVTGYAHVNGILDTTCVITDLLTNIRVTRPVSFATGDVVSIIKPTWQWWAESEHWWGDRFYADVPRVNATGAVQIPSSINSNLESVNQQQPYGIIAYNNNPVTSLWTDGRDVAVTTAQPQFEGEYAFSEGVGADTNGGVLNPSSSFITYGNQATEYEIAIREDQIYPASSVISIPSHGFKPGDQIVINMPAGPLTAWVWSTTQDSIQISTTPNTFTAATVPQLTGYAELTFTVNTVTDRLTVASTASIPHLSKVIYKGWPTVAGLTLYQTYYANIFSGTELFLCYDPQGILPVDFTAVGTGYQSVRRDAGLKVKRVPRERTIFIRARKSSFNDGDGTTPANMYVSVSNVQVPYIASTTAINTWWSYPGISPFTRGTATAPYYCVPFTPAATRLGVSPTARVRVTNTSTQWLGAQAKNIPFATGNAASHDGGFVPVYGLGAYANYKTGDFPSCGCIFQERLALGGFRTRPSTVVVSAVADLLVRGEFYNFFQITDDLELTDADPFDIIISDDNNGRVLAMAEWQNYLFLFTTTSAYRVSGSNGLITPTSRTMTYVASKGTVNARSIAVTENSIYYISDSGLFALPLTNSGDYRAQEISEKIRDYFTPVARDNNASWLCYDPATFKVYMGLDYDNQTNVSPTCFALLVFDIRQEAWTQYTSSAGIFTFNACTYYDKVIGSQLMIGYTANCASGFARFNYKYAIDLATEYTSAGTNATISIPLLARVVTAPQFEYDLEQLSSQYANVEDMRIWIDSTLLVYGVDWWKVGSNTSKPYNIFLGNVRFATPPPVGSTIWYAPLAERTYYGVAMIINDQVVEVDTVPTARPGVICNSYVWNYQTSVLGAGVDDAIGADMEDTIVISTGRVPVGAVTGYVYPAKYQAFFSTGDQLYKHKRLENMSLWMSSMKGVRSMYVGVGYNNEQGDLYGVDVVDDNLYLQDNPEHVVFREAVQSNGYAHRLVLYSTDPFAWSLDAWQASVKMMRGTGHISGE